MTDPVPTKGYSVTQVNLVEMSFAWTIEDPTKETTNRVSFQIQTHAPIQRDVGMEHRLTVVVSGTVDEKKDLWKAAATFSARFLVENESDVDIESVQRVHAPAFLYGFAREAISDLCRRAGLIQVILPPMNFTVPRTPK
ncbi:MAG: protein-export chaperone SecB [Planctomycetota bacterium]